MKRDRAPIVMGEKRKSNKIFVVSFVVLFLVIIVLVVLIILVSINQKSSSEPEEKPEETSEAEMSELINSCKQVREDYDEEKCIKNMPKINEENLTLEDKPDYYITLCNIYKQHDEPEKADHYCALFVEAYRELRDGGIGG